MGVKNNPSLVSRQQARYGRWISVKIPGELYKEIDKTISTITIHGIREYTSIPDFVRQACVQLLTRETSRKNKVLTMTEAKI